MKILFHFLVFPGFLFTAICGLLASWIDRKVTARVQWRVGPPWHQPFTDIVKLFGKETTIPKGASRWIFLSAPLAGLASVTLVSTIIWVMNLNPDRSFIGDLIVVIYLLTIPSISLIIGGFASRNPIASLGASREMKLILAYELPFVLAILVPVIKTGGAIGIGEFLTYQSANGLMIGSLSGIIAFVVMILTMQAKLALVPFDMPEAETEIAGGNLIEYSGAALAMFKLTKAMMLFTMPMFLVIIFMGGIKFSGWSILWGILKYVLLLVIIILIKNTNPRVRIDQAMKFFWGPVLGLSVIAIILSIMGI